MSEGINSKKREKGQIFTFYGCIEEIKCLTLVLGHDAILIVFVLTKELRLKQAKAKAKANEEEEEEGDERISIEREEIKERGRTKVMYLDGEEVNTFGGENYPKSFPSMSTLSST